MIKTIVESFKNKEIRKRIFFTLGILFVFKLGSTIPTPRIDIIKATAYAGNELINILNLLGGGNLQSFSIFALGVGPYITSSIIIQLLSMGVIPALTEMTKSGETGKRQIEKITKYLAVVLSFIQSTILVYSMNIQYEIVIDPSIPTYLYIATVMTAGTMFACWLGDRISAHGIGNGISMIIFAGIVSSLPTTFQSMYHSLITSNVMENMGLGITLFIVFVLIYIFIILLVIFMTQATRKINIQYTSSNLSKVKSDMTYIPIKINSAGVTPVIFASAIIAAPTVILSFISTQNAFTNFLNQILFNLKHPVGLTLYIVLIVLLTFFYTNIQMDPEKMAENLNKNGSYIPGVRPGKDTQNYISVILNRVTVLGAAFIAFISLLPHLLGLFFPDVSSIGSIGGTSIIIAVGVALETTKDIQGKLTQKAYRGFSKK